jgi:hypothetical protein
MKLVAVWIEDFKNLQNITFNFGDELMFKIHFQKENKKKIINLDFEETTDYFNLFSGKKILNISGILGVNGTGKSNFYKLLNLLEADKPIKGDVILIYKIDNKYKIHRYEGDNPLFHLKQPLKLNLSQRMKSEKFQITQDREFFKGSHLIFYSSEFSNYNEVVIKEKNVFNRSTNFRIRSAVSFEKIKKYSDSYNEQNKIKDRLSNKKNLNFDPLSFYFDEKTKNQFDFLTAINKKKKGDQFNFIITPDKVDIVFDDDFYIEVVKFSQNSLCNFTRVPEIISHGLGELNKIKENPVSRFEKEMILRFFLYAFYKDLFNTTNPRVPLDELERFVIDIKLDENIFTRLYTFLLDKTCTSDFFEYSILTRILKNIHDGKYNHGIEQYVVPSFDLFINYTLKVDRTLWSLMNDFNELFKYNSSPFIHFKWYNMSAGEEALLSFFSVLWVAIQKTKFNHVIFCIDEAELYLHPEWQRNLVNYLNTFFEIFVERKSSIKTYQVFISSHSPFVASDIPKFNLTFLSKPEKTKENPNPLPIVVNSQNQTPTFGGNIFSLYKDSFFLDDLFSEFSKNWINEAFNKINDKDSKFKNFEDVVKFSQLIGEPIIKEAILNKINKTGLENWTLKKNDFNK